MIVIPSAFEKNSDLSSAAFISDDTCVHILPSRNSALTSGGSSVVIYYRIVMKYTNSNKRYLITLIKLHEKLLLIF